MPRAASDVARRCLCLELLFQRYLLEADADEPEADRERARAMWLSRDRDLEVADVLAADERAFLERGVGQLSSDELDDVYGRATGAALLLWALGRVTERPTLAAAEGAIAESGLLGDGSIGVARTSAASAALRAEAELDAALGAYRRLRGKAREVDDPERVFADVAVHHLAWVLDPELAFEDDVLT